MRNQTKYLIIYLCVLCLLVGSAVQLAQAQENENQSVNQSSQQEIEPIDQGKLDQMLAPVALYPDTLLSHILVAATYPLEVVQAARWRKANEDLDEQEALNAVEDKDWDPSVKALVPFTELLQKFDEDLEWLESLGNAFLFNEKQVLASVQNLRQKAYAQGNLEDNEYIEVEEDEGEIVIQTVEKEIVYIPYYDTRVVYGNWWWHDYPPHYWHTPRHYVWSAGFYWSPRFRIRPSFYFGGFHWRNRHVVANYHYRSHAKRHWSTGHGHYQHVRVREYPRWTHNQYHRKGVQYRHNGRQVVRNTENPNRYVTVNHNSKSKKRYQINKQRVLNTSDYRSHQKKSSKRIKQELHRNKKQKYVHNKKVNKLRNVDSHKQQIINRSKHQNRQRVSQGNRTEKTRQPVTKQSRSYKTQKYAAHNKQKKMTQYSSTKRTQRESAYRSGNKNKGSNQRYKTKSRTSHSAGQQKSRVNVKQKSYKTTRY